MDRHKFIYVFLSLLYVSHTSCEISYDKKTKLINGFIDFYNSLPNQIYTCNEGYLQNAQQSTEQNSYEIEVVLKVSELHNLESTKNISCTSKVVDLEEAVVSVLNHHCEETPDATIGSEDKELEEIVVTETNNDAVETTFIREPIQLDNEVQTNTAVTSGEQFVAVPREKQKLHCIGCSSHVNPQAPGVSDLAAIGVRQLNSLEPNVQHTLNSIVDVERQVQVVNGIRYILTLVIDYNSCLTPETETCLYSKTCKITFLEKPWVQLPDGSKYRAILSNNCTEEWRFGDNGVVIPQTPADSRENNNINAPQTDGSDVIKPLHNADVQAQPSTEKTLTDDDIKVIQTQIIPHSQFNKEESEPALTSSSEPTEASEPGKQHVVKVEQASQFSPNAIPETSTNPINIDSLSEDKKKAIDDMLNFFNFAGFDSARPAEDKTRIKRSFNSDLNIMNLIGNFQKVKKNVENAKYVYKLAQIVVDYLNEIDLEVKTRVLKDVLNAEEESENHQHFYYIQARVIIPCDKSECKEKDTIAKICNAVLDGTNKNVQILNVFCHDEPKSKLLGKVNSVALDDPILLKLITEATNKIESESSLGKAMKLNKIIDANTQRVSGTLTKFSIMLDLMNCEKTVPPILRSNCSILEELGSQICDVTVHERHWLKEKKITYSCTERPVDTSFSSKRKTVVEKSVNDPAVLGMVNEALQYLDVQSNRNNKQMVVRVNSVATQLVAGFLTDIEFVVGYTTCTNDVKNDTSKCKLLEDEPLRTCNAKIWDRTWIEDGRQVDVSCKYPIIEDSELSRRVKREYRRLGGPSKKDVNHPMFKIMAEEALRKYLQSSVYNRHFKVVSIYQATVQIVAGTLTKLEFKISPTSCLIDKEGNPSSLDCKILDHKDVSTCNSVIWEKPWLDFKEINTTCQVDVHKRMKRQTGVLIGGLHEQDPNDPQFRKLAEESMHKYLANNGNTQEHQVIDIISAATQGVAGKKTRIKFKISPADQKTGDVLSCLSEIWEQPWRQLKEITVNCDIDNLSRTKREILHTRKSSNRRLIGDKKDQDPTRVEYKELAQASLKQYLKLHKNSNLHNVVEVKNVKTQAVSGTIYNIEYIAALESCADDISTCVGANSVLYCTTEVWDRPWLGKKSIDVLCKSNNKKTKTQSKQSFELKEIKETIFREDHREKRQAAAEEYVDEDIRFYYADRAIKQLNDQSNSNNLHKLVTIHGFQNSVHMDQPMVRMYIETSETYCLRHRDEHILAECEELSGINHRLCLVRLWPSSDDDLVVKQVSLVCDDDEKFESISGLSIQALLRASIKQLEKSPNSKYKLVHQGEPQVIPTLDSSLPITINFIVASTNCSKKIELDVANNNNCFLDITRSSKACQSRIWLAPNSRTIRKVLAKCGKGESRKRRSVSLNPSNSTADELIIRNLVQESLHKLEMASSNRYKQRVLQINSYSTKITSGKVTTIDFDVAYTSCLKFEWVEDEKSCEFLEHLPRRHCVSQVWERLWVHNGRNIEVTCEEDETPLEAHVEFESAETAMKLATEALKHIEAKYPHPRRQKVVRIFSLQKQVVAGIHYRMKIEVGSTQCSALSAETDCKLDKDVGNNKFCRVNVWLRPWTNHAPNFRVTCDYQEASTADLYHHVQAELLFHDFIVTYRPEYKDNPSEMKRKFEIFKTNIRKIHELNIHEKGTATYGVTRFADLSYEEFTKKYLGLKPSLRDSNQLPMRQAEIPSLQIPDKFDWRDYGAVTEVKNQGSCGSCWAFSVTGNIEGQWKMQSGQLISLSEQELVDCDKLDQGCNGGLPDNAYRAIEQLGGLEMENDYPYEGEDDKCSFNKTMTRVKITGAVNITTNETGMAKWLVHNGPISIGINANAMQFYMGGVSHPWKMLCNPTNLDHGVLIVGYGIKDYPLFHKRLPYWTIKNSWGPDWGEQGYYRVYRGDGTCGVNQMASSAVI